MNALPDPELSPTSCVAADSPEARALHWMPLAVRFKLDMLALHMSLREWQRLPLAQRAALVAAPLAGAGAFQSLAVASGASAEARRRGEEVGASAGSRLLHAGGDVERWLACATPFAQYVARKVLMRKECGAAA